MSRKKRQTNKKEARDPKYNNELIGKFINHLMIDGKKSIAENIVYSALESFSKNVEEEPLEAFQISLSNIIPKMEVRSRRVGGSTYQVPVEVRNERGKSLGLRWIISFSRKRSGKTMIEKLSSELLDAYNKTGGSFKKKEDTHKMAEANKAFAHFRW